MKRLIGILTIAIVGMSMGSCNLVSVDGGEEAVLIKKPLFWGSGGVVEEPVTDGLTWCAVTTDDVKFNVKPVQFEEVFQDIITADNNPVDFNAYIKLKIQNKTTPYLYDEFGIEWYKNNVQQSFRKLCRNLCSEHQMFTLTTDRSVVDSLQDVVFDEMTAHLKLLGMPVDVQEIHIGRVVPPKEVLVETKKTAAEKQRKITQGATEDAEKAREGAERQRAIADNAYKNQMGFSNDQYLEYRNIQVRLEQLEVVRGKDGVKVIMNTGAVPMSPYVNAD